MPARESTEHAARATRNVTTMELEADRAIVISRTFDAPPHIVFEAWTKPELVSRWWAPKSHATRMLSCEADVREGGKYRYVLENRDGSEAAFSGEYTEITPPSRVVYTQIFEPYPGPPAIITVTFEPHGEKTRLVAREVYPSAEVRDIVLASGMEHGMRETMDQLDELVASLPR